MSEPTPGPWVFDPENNGNESGYGNGITTEKSGWTLAHIPCRNPDWKANARLIAAAPDLLEAARALVMSCRLPDGTDVPPTITAVVDLEAAIAKAEGR